MSALHAALDASSDYIAKSVDQVFPSPLDLSLNSHSEEYVPLWVIDADQMSNLAGLITSRILRSIDQSGIDEYDQEDDQIESYHDLMLIPVGDHGLFGLSRKNGQASMARFTKIAPTGGPMYDAVLSALSDALDVLPIQIIEEAVGRISETSWMNFMAYPGAVRDLRNPYEASSRIGRLESLVLEWCAPDHRIFSRSAAGDLEMSLESRLVARLEATSLDETCHYIANAFMNKVISVHKHDLRTLVKNKNRAIRLAADDEECDDTDDVTDDFANLIDKLRENQSDLINPVMIGNRRVRLAPFHSYNKKGSPRP